MKQEEVQELKVRHTFPMKLDDSELAKMGQEAGRISAEIRKDEVDFSEVKKTWKVKIEKKVNHREDLLEKITRGKEDRELDCVKRFDWEKRQVSFVCDNEILDERDMSYDELQMKMDFKENSKKGKTNNKADEAEVTLY